MSGRENALKRVASPTRLDGAHLGSVGSIYPLAPFRPGLNDKGSRSAGQWLRKKPLSSKVLNFQENGMSIMSIFKGFFYCEKGKNRHVDFVDFSVFFMEAERLNVPFKKSDRAGR